jgi:phosphoribosylformylglycinamidine synthase
MMSALAEIVPVASEWPKFRQNRSKRFEARLALVEVLPSKSVLFAGMQGSILPIAVAHGEGRAVFASESDMQSLILGGQVCARFVDHQGAPTEHYPENPNGSPGGITAITNGDGRITLMMPHPERLFLARQFSYRPPQLRQAGPWIRLFQNARVFVG